MYIHVALTESQINSIISALDLANYKLDVGYGDADLELRRKLHTALTLEKIKRIDEED
jgi:hypothetical protein